MKTKNDIKNKISSLVICASTFAGITSLGTTIATINSKIRLNRDINERKLQYYEEQTIMNNILIRTQINEYNNIIQDFRKAQIKELYKKIIYIPDEYRNQVIKALGDNENEYNYRIIFEEDLKKMTSLELIIGDVKAFNFLKYCKNLENLKVKCDKNDITFLDCLPVTSVKRFELDSDIDTFNYDIASLLYKKMPYIEELNISSPTTYEPGVIESLKQIKKLTIKPTLNCDIDFNNLTHLEELVIDSEKPYDIAIWLNKEEYNTLKDNNVKITFKENVEEKYLEVSEKLDNILNSLEINENSSDDEILDEVLKYAIKNYKYDEAVANATPEEKKQMKIGSNFYKNGELYAAIEKDTQVCGNYAAFVEAMYDRLKKPEQSYILTSKNHAWNLIDIEGKKYYVDSTWLDIRSLAYCEELLTSEEAADRNLHKCIHWYKEDPKSDFIKENQEKQESHLANNMVEYETDTYIKTDYTITTPNIIPTVTTTTTHPVLTISTQKIDAEKFDQEKNYFERIYNKDLKTSLTSTTVFLTTAAVLQKKKKSRKNKKQKKLVK